MVKTGDRILKKMQEKNYSYYDLEKLTGISKSALQRYVTGQTEEIPAGKLNLIAKALACRSSWLAGWEEEEQSEKTVPDEEAFLLECFRKLNAAGKSEIRGELKQMVKNPKFTTETK